MKRISATDPNSIPATPPPAAHGLRLADAYPSTPAPPASLDREEGLLNPVKAELQHHHQAEQGFPLRESGHTGSSSCDLPAALLRALRHHLFRPPYSDRTPSTLCTSVEPLIALIALIALIGSESIALNLSPSSCRAIRRLHRSQPLVLSIRSLPSRHALTQPGILDECTLVPVYLELESAQWQFLPHRPTALPSSKTTHHQRSSPGGLDRLTPMRSSPGRLAGAMRALHTMLQTLEGDRIA